MNLIHVSTHSKPRLSCHSRWLLLRCRPAALIAMATSDAAFVAGAPVAECEGGESLPGSERLCVYIRHGAGDRDDRDCDLD